MPKKQVSEDDCWFVIGAHQAGASERQCSELVGLSKTITHNIIHNFKKLGSPHATKLVSVQDLINTTKGNSDTPNYSKKRKYTDTVQKEEGQKPRKRGRPRKPMEAPFFTQFIVRDALLEARTDPPYAPNLYPMDRLNTPPSDDDNKKQRRDSSLMLMDELPPTPGSTSDDTACEEQEAKGTEEWSFKDDEMLFSHVLGLPLKNFKWKQIEFLFGDRHLAKMCSERWDFLKKQILKDINVVRKENEES